MYLNFCFSLLKSFCCSCMEDDDGEPKVEEPETIVVTNTLQRRYKHPPQPILQQQNPQIIGKHRVTTQQIYNAVNTLFSSINNTIVNPLGQKQRFLVDRLRSLVFGTICKTCDIYISKWGVSISKPDSSSGSMQLHLTSYEIHEAKHHGDTSNHERIITFLGLKPGVCYAPVEVPVLKWDHYESYPRDATEILTYFTSRSKLYDWNKDKLYDWNKDNVSVMVYDVDAIRWAIVASDKQVTMMIEGVCLTTPLWDSNHNVHVYELVWTNQRVLQDWFSM